jgi:hypothetical protein
MNTISMQAECRGAPISNVDPYSDEALIDPWDMYKSLRHTVQPHG